LPIKDNEEMDNLFKYDEFNREYIEHIRKKDEIRKKIEALERDKIFYEQLKPDQVTYMFQKKYEEKARLDAQEFKDKYNLDEHGSPNRRKRSPTRKQKLLEDGQRRQNENMAKY